MVRTLVVVGCALVAVGCKSKDESKTGPVYVQPAREIQIKGPHEDPTYRDHEKPDPLGESIRKKSIESLRAAGFAPAEWLPTAGHRAGVPGSPRPSAQVAQRLLALATVVNWVVAPEDKLSSGTLTTFVSKGGLRSALAPEELAILALSREEAAKQHRETIGWRMENLWPLAWAVGFTQTPSPAHKQVGPEIMRPLLHEFLPSFESDPDAWIRAQKLRPATELVELEDLFYCAHNAVRSAQTGHASTVPKGFHPVMHGGAVHERRHSLTWILSPGVAWDNTDLST